MTIDEYQEKALKTALPTTKSLAYATLGLTSEAGEAAGKLKKWIRDQNSDPEKLDKEALADEFGDALWYIALAAEQLGFTLDEIANKNISKLSNRYEKGVITGSGDNR